MNVLLIHPKSISRMSGRDREKLTDEENCTNCGNVQEETQLHKLRKRPIKINYSILTNWRMETN